MAPSRGRRSNLDYNFPRGYFDTKVKTNTIIYRHSKVPQLQATGPNDSDLEHLDLGSEWLSESSNLRLFLQLTTEI